MNDFRVMLISPIPPPAGGISTWTYKYLQYCKNTGKNVYLVNTSLVGKRAETVSDSIHVFDEIKRSLHIWHEIAKGIKTYHPQVIHLNTNCSPRGIVRDFISACMIRANHIPYIVHCRCNVRDQIGKSRAGIIFFTRLVKKAAIVLVQNDHSRKYIKRVCGIKSYFIPNFIESDYITDHKDILENVKKAIFVGHVRKTKGIEELIAVASSNKEIEFILAGPVTDDYSKETLQNRSDNLRILDARESDEIKKLLDEADIFFFPTYTEGFSNSLLEAMARGLPVITTNAGANEIMLGGKGGIIADVHDLESLKKAFHDIMPQAVRQKMSAYNIEKVKQEYSQEQVMEKIWSVYKKIIAGC